MSFEVELERLKADYEKAKAQFDKTHSQADFEKVKFSLRKWAELNKLAKVERLIGIPAEKDIALKGIEILQKAIDELDAEFRRFRHSMPFFGSIAVRRCPQLHP